MGSLGGQHATTVLFGQSVLCGNVLSRGRLYSLRHIPTQTRCRPLRVQRSKFLRRGRRDFAWNAREQVRFNLHVDEKHLHLTHDGSRYFSAGHSAPRPRVTHVTPAASTSAPLSMQGCVPRQEIPQHRTMPADANLSQGCSDVGIGVVLEIDPLHKIVLKSLVKDGPAARSGLLQVPESAVCICKCECHLTAAFPRRRAMPFSW
jgi:hypothetical protein